MDSLERLAREVGGAIGEGPGPERRRQQRRAVARMTAGPIAHVPWTQWGLSLALVAGALLLVWFWRGAAAEGSLSARFGDRPFAAGAWLAAEREPVTLELSDRSRVVFAPAAAARLVRVDAQTVALNLERGSLELAVVAAPTRVWQVAAGPFAVETTGARFSLEWQPQPLALAVAVREGEVRIAGGTLPARGTVLGSNQRLEVSAAPASAVAAGAEGDLSSGIGVATTATVPATPPTVVAAGPRPRGEPEWRRLAAEGRHAAALAAVERAGLARELDRLAAEDLERLAHSARLAGAAEVAREALQVLRRRFPRDPRARPAAFLLGRVAFDLVGDPSLAADWFATYVREEPAGSLAEEARGRILEIRRDHGDSQQARAAAQDYLEHHPGGSRAAVARRMLDPR